MNTCVIDSVTLEPYSSELMIIVSGYNCDEVKEWFVDAFGYGTSNNLAEAYFHSYIMQYCYKLFL